ncbi:MAG: hypothetical protein AB7O44_27490 [Hyphomicrobiaceae bacterium]
MEEATKPTSDTGFHVRHARSNSTAEVVVYRRLAPTLEGEMALRLIDRWGLVCAQADGEDSAGRQKARRATPQEVVAMACETAAEAMAEFKRRDWLIAVPSPEEADRMLSDKEEDAIEEHNAKVTRKRRFF